MGVSGLALKEGVPVRSEDIPIPEAVVTVATDVPSSRVKSEKLQSPWTPMENFKRALWMVVGRRCFGRHFTIGMRGGGFC